MRTASSLDPLVSPTVQAVLAATLLSPERGWHLRDLAHFVRRAPSSLQRPLSALTRAGILKRRRDGNRVYYQADNDSPFFAELQGLIIKTVGLLQPLKDALRPFAPLIDVAFVHGSVATGAERSSSDIDLVVIGRVALIDLASPLRRVETRIGRPINVTLLTPRELATRYKAGGPYAASLLQSERLFIQGDAADLERAAGRRARGAAHDESPGTR
jgi:predicted nucleotidyltransferase